MPPPLKECNCLIELPVQEYQVTKPLGRQHRCFGGREAMEYCQKTLRSSYHVHLMVPGKKQMGPLSIIAKSIHEAISALAWLLLESWCVEHNESLEVRIYRNVQEGRDCLLRGIFPCRLHEQEVTSTMFTPLSQPVWLFQSPAWVVLACRLGLLSNDGSQNDTDKVSATLSIMQPCLDNVVFQLGQETVGKVDIFIDYCQEYAFAVGDPDQSEVLRKEIAKVVDNTSR
jgi:hypothetical protein